MRHGEHREWAGVALRSLAAECIADGGRGNKGVSWGSSLVMALTQSRERVSCEASSHPCTASCMAGMDDNQARSGLGGPHSCTAVLCDMGTNRGMVPLEPPPWGIWPR